MTYPALFIEITTPFKDSMRHHMHRACLDAFANRNSEFWRDGKPRRDGTLIRRAFWRGFYGKLDAHEPDSMVFAAARAGRDMGKQWRNHLPLVIASNYP